MPVVAIVAGVLIRFYYADHEPAHFHAILGEAEMIVRIADLAVIAGALPPASRRAVLHWAQANQEALAGACLAALPSGAASREDRMILQRILAAEALPGPRLRLRFADGFHGIVPLAALLRQGGVFTAIAAHPDRFAIAPSGRALVWTDADGEEIDLCADALRRMAASVAGEAAE